MRRGRSRLSTRCSLLLLGALLCAPPGWGQDRSGADVDEDLPRGWRQYVRPVLERGGVGTAFFPSVYAGSELAAVLNPSGYEVHMTPADDPGEELVHPAGEPFVPPGGRWRIWLQGPGAMSEATLLVKFTEIRAPTATSAHYVSVGPAGRVVLTDDAEVEQRQELWVIHADSPRDFRYEFSRRRPVSEAGGEGVLMPAGTALAALWDREDERYVALSRPFEVRAGEAVPAPLREPASNRAHLLVYAERRGHADSDPLMDLAPTLTQGSARRRPDATVVTEWGVYCVWYDFPAGPAVLADGNRRLYIEPQNLELTGGEILRVDATLLDRPFLDVGLLLPPRLREKPFTLAVRRLADGEELAHEELRRDAGRHRFESLVQRPLEVVLETHLGLFRQRVDLTGLTEGFDTLEPTLIELAGKVSRGGEPQPAEIEFVTDFGDRVKATAGEDGAYRALALQPIRAVSVQLEGTREPWLHAFVRSIAESRELDLELPEADGGDDPALPANPGGNDSG